MNKDDYVNLATAIVVVGFALFITCLLAVGGIIIVRAVW